MTKIKNTKKGMAKKTLSISLAVAMLATSNVPVWAAEDLFTDGEVAVETFTAEDDVVEAPVVEEVEAAAAEDTSVSSPKTTLALAENSWANPIKASGRVIDKDGNTVTNYGWAWKVDGVIGDTWGKDYGVTTHGEKGIKAYNPTSDDIGHTVQLLIYDMKDGWREDADPVIGNDDYVWASAPVTVSKASVAVHKDDFYEGNWADWEFSYSLDGQNDIKHVVEYNGKYRLLNDWTKLGAKVKFENKVLDVNNKTIDYLNNDDFDFTCELEAGNGIDAGSVFVIKGTPKREDLYEGVITYDYKIEKKDETAFSFAFSKDYEYTGKKIVPEVGDIEVYDEAGDRHLLLNSEEVIKSIDSERTSKHDDKNVTEVGRTWTAVVKLNNVPNYKETAVEGKTFKAPEYVDLTFNTVKRDLSNVDITIDDIAYTGSGILSSNDRRFEGKVHFFDRTTGEELKLIMGTDYEVIVQGRPAEGTQAYSLSIQAPARSGNTANGQIVDFTLGNHTFKSEGYELTKAARDYLEEAVYYTGKTAVKDASKVVFSNGKKQDYKELSPENYSVEVIGVDAGRAKVVITGLLSYKECVETYYFDIKPLTVEVKAQKKVVFNKGYVTADQYAPQVTVKAIHPVTGKAVDVAVPEEGYKVTYNFATGNIVGQNIYSKVQILDKNFKGGDTVFYGANNADLRTLIARRDLSADTVTAKAEKDSYVYTGGVIRPNLIVMDGTEPLTAGVDYEVVRYEHATDVGTGTVVIKGIGENNTDINNGIYDSETERKVDFTITPADAADVTVEWAAGNTGVTYTGSAIKPTIHRVTLNGNDVSNQFDYVYPETNINVGTGHVTLKPVYGNKNFTGQKDAEFAIAPRELEGTLKVYDEKGREYSVRNGFLYDNEKGSFVKFAFDGTEHTFTTKFVPANNEFKKFVTENDYEVVYIDNKYGKVMNADEVAENGHFGRARVAVIGKGNFIGGDTVENASGAVVNVVEGTAHSFLIEKYEIMKQHVVIADGEYAAGQPVRPNVTVTVGGRTLVENVDYKILYNAISDLTDGKTMKVSVEGINGYTGVVEGRWGVVKKDMANTQVVLGLGKNPTVTVYNSGVKVPASEYTVTYENDGVTVTAKEGSAYYTGSVFAEYVDDTNEKPSTPVITDVVANGNKVSVVLAGESTGAAGYDYVIDTNRDSINVHKYNKVNKNILTTKTDFTYIQQGGYYVYCHAWKRGEDGQKIFSDWSNGMYVTVGAVTPETPVITSVVAKGSTVTVTYTAAENAAGYDVVLGTALKYVAREKRPVEYGTLVKKNIKGNVVTATFTNVPAGTYYAGLHAFNRTNPDNNYKVFSPWSNSKKVTVR